MKLTYYHIITSVLLMSFLLACNKDKQDVLEKETFINILVDLHLYDAVLSDKGYYDGNLTDSTTSYYHYILKKYQISRSAFDRSVKYYNKNGDEYLEIYKEVIEIISHKVPVTIHKESIYKFVQTALDDSKILSDLEAYYGKKGKELWPKQKAGELPKDKAKIPLKLTRPLAYPCQLVFNCEIQTDKDTICENLFMQVDIKYEDKSIQSDTIHINYSKKWQKYQMKTQTDSLKKPQSFDFYLLKCDGKKLPVINIKNISLKQFAPTKN